MITYQSEMLEDVAEELCPLLELHYQDLTAHKEFIKLAPDWDRYYQMEFLGKLVAFTADYRVGLGAITLIRLIKFSESEIKKIAGEEKIRILWHIKKNHDFSPALHRMGYADEEVIVGKLL